MFTLRIIIVCVFIHCVRGNGCGLMKKITDDERATVVNVWEQIKPYGLQQIGQTILFNFITSNYQNLFPQFQGMNPNELQNNPFFQHYGLLFGKVLNKIIENIDNHHFLSYPRSIGYKLGKLNVPFPVFVDLKNIARNTILQLVNSPLSESNPVLLSLEKVFKIIMELIIQGIQTYNLQKLK